MKTKTKKNKSALPPFQEKKQSSYHRKKYRNCDFSGFCSTDYYKRDHRRDYKQCPNYTIYSKYKYRAPAIRKSSRTGEKKHFTPRPASPVLGSEEYMKKKIEQRSAIIMKQLLNPVQECFESIKESSHEDKGECSTNTETRAYTKELSGNSGKSRVKKSTIYNIDEIHKKIINHITNLKDGKKKNLINFNMSSYGVVIDQIQKQKRLEISRALRVMCSQSNDKQESSDFINSIIPDIGIKIEDLPPDLIEELTNTLNLDPDWNNDDIINNHFGNNQFLLDSNEMNSTSINKPEDHGKLADEIYIKSEQNDEQNETESTTNQEFNDKEWDKYKSNLSSTVKEEIIDYDSLEYVHDINKDVINTDCGSINDDVNDSKSISETLTAIKKEIFDDELDSNINDKNEVPFNYQDTIDGIKKGICEVAEVEDCNYAPQSICSETEHVGNGDELNPNQSTISQTEMCKVVTNDENSYTERGSLPCKENDSEISRHDIMREKNYSSRSDISTQTEENAFSISCAEKLIDCLLAQYSQKIPNSFPESVSRMLEIDQCVLRLTNYRQSLFTNMKPIDEVDRFRNNSEETAMNNDADRRFPEETPTNARVITSAKKRKKNMIKKINKKKKLASANDLEAKCSDKDLDSTPESSEKSCNENSEDNIKKSLEVAHSYHLKLPNLHEKILVLQVVEDKLVAGTESGKVIFFSLENGYHKKTLNVCSVPITSLLFKKQDNQDNNSILMYVGSLNNVMKIYNFCNRSIVDNIFLEDSVQCMESNWGYIFIGCTRGMLFRYSLKKKIVESEDKFSDSSILVVKAIQEGARRVLLIGSRNSPLCIRDAMTGLYMRIMDGVISPTVYSLIIEKSLIYCGTTNHDILVYSFHDGKLIQRHDATGSKGIGCMKIVNNLLFASCHNGNIYVYDIKQNIFITKIEGPGGAILTMEILGNQVIVGTMSFKFVVLQIPDYILQHKL